MGVNGYQTMCWLVFFVALESGEVFEESWPNPLEGKLHSACRFLFFFSASVEILLDILADNTKKKQVPWGPSFQGNLTAAPAALLTPPAVVPTHIFKGAVAMDGN